MKKIYIIANWKSNKTEEEATRWLEEFSVKSQESRVKDNVVVVCPPFTLLPLLHSYFLTHNSEIELGSQDVSPFPLGAYTGEVAAKQLKEYVSYVIIGHSERRKYFHEDEVMLSNKVDMALEQDLMPIYCFSDVDDIIPRGVKIVAYEPVFAIGTGEPDDPTHINDVARTIKEKNAHIETVLYGGSVEQKNIKDILSKEYISGVLVGSASLDAISFSALLKETMGI